MSAFSRVVTHRRVIVNLDDGTTFEGVFWRQAGPLVVLKTASIHLPGKEPTPLDGDVIIERARVVFIQAP